MARAAIAELLRTALETAANREGWQLTAVPTFVVEPPRDAARADYASNLALSLAKTLGRPPMDIARAIADRVPETGVATVEVAPPGFLNFRLRQRYLLDQLVRPPETDGVGFKLAALMADHEDGWRRERNLRVVDGGSAVEWGSVSPEDRCALRIRLLTSPPPQGLVSDLAEVRREVLDNPWFFIRQALDRMESILATAADEGLAAPSSLDDEALSHPDERRLLLQTLGVEGEMALALELGQMSRVVRAATDLATSFHHFYAACRVFGEVPQVAGPRLALIAGATNGLKRLLEPLDVTPIAH